jgi:hypothetical protein
MTYGGSSLMGLKVSAGFGLLVLAVLTQFMVGCETSGQEDGETPELQRFQLRGEEFRAFAAEYGAVVDWDSALRASLATATPPIYGGSYTLDVQDALIRDEPVAFMAQIIDLSRDGTGIRAVFGYPYADFESVILFVLRVEADYAQSMVDTPHGRWWAVVAQIEDVRATSLTIDAAEG